MGCADIPSLRYAASEPPRQSESESVWHRSGTAICCLDELASLCLPSRSGYSDSFAIATANSVIGQRGQHRLLSCSESKTDLMVAVLSLQKEDAVVAGSPTEVSQV